MFSEINQIRQYITSRGYVVDSIDYIDKGVMTDKYRVVSSGKRYIARCYPARREWLAKVEFLYLNFFQPLGIKTPKPAFYNDAPAILFYEEIEGQSLDEVYDTLSDEEKESLCREIIDNYNKICKINTSGFGRITGYDKWSHSTWADFLNETVDNGYEGLSRDNRTVACGYVDDMRNSLSSFCHFKKSLVWSDFCKDNIIVTRDHHLAGFVDLEGLIAGDSALGVGYLKAHDVSDFTERIIKIGNYDVDRTDFYAVLRYLGLIPYQDQALPNGAERTPVSQYLSYSHKLLESIGWSYSTKRFIKKYMRTFVTFIALCLNIAICIFGACMLKHYYNEALSHSNIVVENQAKGIPVIRESPSWFKMSDDSLYACKVIGDNDKVLLNALVPHEDSLYTKYSASIDELSYKSNNNPGNFAPLFMLTLLLVSLGCCALTFYDYIGHVCYLKDQDMLQWWPWYIFRPLIVVPLASLLIVAVRTTMFSNVFTSSDLNTYAVISFLVGFSMMEFLKMLRRLGKSLFGGEK